MSQKQPLVLVGLGEALFDCFPDRSVLGGAPLNFAVHANRLVGEAGGQATPLCRVGTDELGDQAFAVLRGRGVSTEFLQCDPARPTGRVRVTLDADGVADYAFDEDSAWDHLKLDAAARELAERCDAVCFGSLAQRSPTSRATIRSFLRSANNALRLFDVNLRQAYYSAEVLDESLRLATAAKTNEEELRLLVETLLPEGDRTDDPGAAAARLRERYHLDWLAVTRGPRGVALATADGWLAPSATPTEFEPSIDADTVGAGDACCAALAVGRLLAWPDEATLRFAHRVGAFVASKPGATPELPDSLVAAVARG